MDIIELTLDLISVVIIALAVHELGHWLVAKVSGLWAPIFSIGIGKPYLTIMRAGGTQFRLAPLLLAGYVKVYWSEPDDEVQAEYRRVSQETGIPMPDKIAEFSTGWHVCLLMAGVVMNAILAVVALYAAVRIAGFGWSESVLQALTQFGLAWRESINSLPFMSDSFDGPWNNPLFQHGFERFLGWLAWINVMLIPWNMLPVPGLDGGGLLDLVIIRVTGASIFDDKNKWLLARFVLAGLLIFVGVLLFELGRNAFHLFEHWQDLRNAANTPA